MDWLVGWPDAGLLAEMVVTFAMRRCSLFDGMDIKRSLKS